MKVEDILNEMSDEDVIGDTGEKPAQSPEEKKAAWMKANDEKVAAMRADRDANRRAPRSRLRGRGRGTGGGVNIKAPGNM